MNILNWLKPPDGGFLLSKIHQIVLDRYSHLDYTSHTPTKEDEL